MTAFHIVLIRGIGGPSHSLMTMKALEQAVIRAGIGEARSVLATGNFVVRSHLAASAIADCFEQEMRKKKLERPVIMRTPLHFRELADAGASHPAVLARPSQLLVSFFQKPIPLSIALDIKRRVTFEDVFLLKSELAIDFGGPVSDSKLTLDFLESCAGSTGTSRNWNTVLKLLAIAGDMGWVPQQEAQ